MEQVFKHTFTAVCQFIDSGIYLKEADEEGYFTLTKLADKSIMIAAHKKGHYAF
jgi:hypothetical protein